MMPRKKQIAFTFAMLACLTAFSQSIPDGQRLVQEINRFPANDLNTYAQGFHFTTVPQPYTQKEILKMKLSAVSVCLDNNWAYSAKEKSCIRYSYDRPGNLTQSSLIDSAGKALQQVKYSYLKDSKNQVAYTFLTTVPAAWTATVTCHYNAQDQLVSRAFKRIGLNPPGSNQTPQINSEEPIPGRASPESDDFTEQYTYHANGKLKQYVLKQGNTRTSVNYTYDTELRLIGSRHLVEQTVYYQYTPHDMDQKSWGDSTIKIHFSWDYSYDAATGYLARARMKHDHGTDNTTQYTYNRSGMITRSETFLHDTVSGGYELHFYDGAGRKVKTERWSAAGLKSTSLYKHTCKGQQACTTVETTVSALGYAETARTYDAEGRLLSEKGRSTGHTTGDSKIYESTFQKTIRHEYFK